MSQVLKEMPGWALDRDALGRPSRYPWKQWFDGGHHLLVRGETGDYVTESRFFRHTVLRAAERRDLDVLVVVRSGRHYDDGHDRMLVKAILGALEDAATDSVSWWERANWEQDPVTKKWKDLGLEKMFDGT